MRVENRAGDLTHNKRTSSKSLTKKEWWKLCLQLLAFSGNYLSSTSPPASNALVLRTSFPLQPSIVAFPLLTALPGVVGFESGSLIKAHEDPTTLVRKYEDTRDHNGNCDIVLSLINELGEILDRESEEYLIKIYDRDEDLELPCKIRLLEIFGERKSISAIGHLIDAFDNEELFEASVEAMLAIFPHADGVQKREIIDKLVENPTEEVKVAFIDFLENEKRKTTQIALIQGMGKIRDSRFVDPLLQYQGRDDKTTVALLISLGQIGDPRVIPIFGKILESRWQSTEVSKAAINGLTHFGEYGNVAIPDNDSNGFFSWIFSNKIQKKPKEYLLEKAEYDGSWWSVFFGTNKELQMASIQSLSRYIDGDVVHVLLQNVKENPGYEMKREALMGLGQIGDNRIFTPLLSLAKDEQLRALVIDVMLKRYHIANIENKEKITLFLKEIVENKSNEQREVVHKAIDGLAEKIKWEKAYPILSRAAKNGNGYALVLLIKKTKVESNLIQKLVEKMTDYAPALVTDTFGRSYSKFTETDSFSQVARKTKEKAAALFNEEGIESKDRVTKSEYFSFAVDLDPNHSTYSRNLALTSMYLGKNNEALEFYSRSIKLNPNNGEVYYLRAIVYSTLGLIDEAILDYTDAIEKGYKQCFVYAERGALYDSVGNYLYAKEDFEKAVELQPANADYRHYLGNALGRLKKYDEASKQHREAETLDRYKYQRLDIGEIASTAVSKGGKYILSLLPFRKHLKIVDDID